MSSGLLKTIVVLAVIGVALYDGGAVLVNQFQLDEAAGDAIRIAAQDYGTHRSANGAETVANEVLEELTGAELSEFTVDEVGMRMTVGRPAPVLVLDRIPPLADWAHGAVTKTAEFR